MSTVARRFRYLAVAGSAMALSALGLVAAGSAGTAAAAASPGTTLQGSVTTTCSNDLTYPWTAAKSVSPDTLNLSSGDTGKATYTVTVTKGEAQGGASISGVVTITNAGAVPTQGLAGTLKVSLPAGGSLFLDQQALDMSPAPVLGPGGTGTYPYKITLGDYATAGTTYKVTAAITIGNHSGSQANGFSPKSTCTLPGQTVHNASVTVSDSWYGNLGTGDGGTGPVTGNYQWVYPREDFSAAGDYQNTVTVYGDGGQELAEASAVVQVNVSAPWLWEVDNGNFTLQNGGTWWWTLQNAGAFSDTYPNYGYADAGILMDLGPLSSLPSTGITVVGSGDIKANIWVGDGSMAYTPGYYSSVDFSYGFESASGSGMFWMATGPQSGQTVSVADLQAYYALLGQDPEVYAWVGVQYGNTGAVNASVSSINGNSVGGKVISITPSGDNATVTVDIH